MTLSEALALVQTLLNLIGLVVMLWKEDEGGEAMPTVPPPPPPSSGPSGEIIWGPEAEMLLFRYEEALARWYESGRRGPKPRLQLGMLLIAIGTLCGIASFALAL